jgi:drug/metabolite transporter (DMT)-like permease
MNDRRRRVWAVLLLALAGCFWGTGFLFGKIAFREMNVAENVTFRFVAASLVLSPVLFRRWTNYRASELSLLFLAAGVGGPVQFVLQFRGLQLTTVSHASLIVGVLPVILALSSAFFLHERLHLLEWGMLAISATGAVLIALSSRNSASGPQPSLKGDLLVLLSMFAAAAMILCSKRLLERHDALQVTASLIASGTIMLIFWAELSQPLRFHFSWTAWSAVVAQGLLATAGAYLCWNWGLAHIPASRASVFLNLEPVVGAILGMAVLHERLGPMAIVGGVLIVSAAVFFSVRTHHA